jgi:hypothetical protein
LRQAQDPPCLLEQASLLERYTIGIDDVDLRNHVESDLLAEAVLLSFAATQQIHSLRRESLHRGAAAA